MSLDALRILQEVARQNPRALRLAAQLVGCPACPVCDHCLPDCLCAPADAGAATGSELPPRAPHCAVCGSTRIVQICDEHGPRCSDHLRSHSFCPQLRPLGVDPATDPEAAPCRPVHKAGG